jgi:hypothetical protein
MATNFPTSLDTYTNPTSGNPLNSPDHAGQHVDKNDAVLAIEAKVGVNNSAVTTSLDYLVKHHVILDKTVDETKNSDVTTADDAVLKFTADANGKYYFQLQVFFTTVAAADFKYQFNGPAGSTLITFRRDSNPASTNATTAAFEEAYYSTDTALTSASSGSGQIRIYGVLHNGVTAGTVAFRWAQNTSNAGNTTVRAGSYFSYTKVA